MILLASADATLMDRGAIAIGGRGTLVRRVADIASVEGALAGRQPAVLLLDLALCELAGAASIAELSTFSSSTHIVAMSRQPSDDEGVAVLRAGARGYCNVHIDSRLLAKAVGAVQNGEVWVGRRLVDRLVALVGGAARPPMPDVNLGDLDLLTAREREIAKLVGNGLANKAIAARLGITERTVKAHLGAVFSKLEVHDRLQLALLVTGHLQRDNGAFVGHKTA
jgi:DNA-binding NarL/FixJ family response regulator